MSTYITWIKYGLFVVFILILGYRVFILTKKWKRKWKKDMGEDLDFDLSLSKEEF